MGLVPHVNQQHLDANGDPLSGGTLTFSVTGTSTAKAVYSDAALTSSLGSTVTLDSLGLPSSSGNVVNVFGSGSYRVILKNSGGTTLWTLNELDADGGTAFSEIIWLGTITGTDTLTASPSPAVDAYEAGQEFRFIAANNNTTAVTLEVSSLGGKAVQNNGNALEADDIVAGKVYAAIYDGTQFQLQHLSLPHHRHEAVSFEADATVTDTVTLLSTDAGASAAPDLILRRAGGSQTANDVLGKITFRGQDDAPANEDYAAIQATVIDATAANPDGRLDFHTDVAGTTGAALHIAQGVWTPTATGGDKGADTINVSEYYTDGSTLARWVKVESQTASSSASLDFEDIPTGTKVFRLDITGLVPATDDVLLFIRVKVGGSFQSDATDYDWTYRPEGGGAITDASDSEIEIGDNDATHAVGNAAGEFLDGEIVIQNPLGTSLTKIVSSRIAWVGAEGTLRQSFGAGRYITGTEALQGVQILFESGNIASGTVTAYALLD